jgi:hypothetical protein
MLSKYLVLRILEIFEFVRNCLELLAMASPFLILYLIKKSKLRFENIVQFNLLLELTESIFFFSLILYIYFLFVYFNFN